MSLSLVCSGDGTHSALRKWREESTYHLGYQGLVLSTVFRYLSEFQQDIENISSEMSQQHHHLIPMPEDRKAFSSKALEVEDGRIDFKLNIDHEQRRI